MQRALWGKPPRSAQQRALKWFLTVQERDLKTPCLEEGQQVTSSHTNCKGFSYISCPMVVIPGQALG